MNDWRKRNKDRAKNLVRTRNYYKKIKADVLEHYSTKPPICIDCGENDIALLSIDHVLGGGKDHCKSLGISEGYTFYLWLRRNDYPQTPPLQVLCLKCQKTKQTKNNERK